MNNIVFLSNELVNPQVQRVMKLPIDFISFGIIKGRMYSQHKHNGSFVLPVDVKKKWGNEVVYGGIFLCKEFEFYARILDAYHACSLTALLCNHILDINHRVMIDVQPIYFSSLEELGRLKYREGEKVKMHGYMGNPNHPRIIKRINDKKNSYRIIDGVDIKNFKQLWEEVARDERV